MTLPDFGFDAATVALIRQQKQHEDQIAGIARAVRTANRKNLRRANSEKHLAELLPPLIADGESWHVLSRGDVDALSYAVHVLAGMEYASHLLISTWCMAEADVQQVDTWLDTGIVERLTLCVGKIFPNQYGDEYEHAKQLAERYEGTRVVVARNHSKVTLLANDAASYYIAIESSANVNTNPRIEQTAVHRSEDLYRFYDEQFSGLRSIVRSAIPQAGVPRAHAQG